MPAEAQHVGDSLRQFLPEAVEVRQIDEGGRPMAIIKGGGIAETWVDLWTTIGGDPDAQADAVAATIIELERWPTGN